MRALAIGKIDCHVCGLEADVKQSEKSGLAYTFCSDCNVQSFCRNKHQHDKLTSKMRAVTVTEKTPPVIEKTQPVIVVTEKKPAASGFNLGNL